MKLFTLPKRKGGNNMLYVSDIYTTRPDNFKNKLQKVVYKTLEELSIHYERVETDEAITMEDCTEIDKKLKMKMVKTLFLCNRQKTDFYLFITCGNKRFDAKKFGSELGISRVSFADEILMQEMLGTKIGSATIFSSLLDNDNKVRIIIDIEVLKQDYYGCSDGTTTGYMKIKTNDIVDKVLPFSHHKETILEM